MRAPVRASQTLTDLSQPADATSVPLTFHATDAANGMSNRDGVITISDTGAYFVVAAAQVGGRAKGSVRLWMRINGKDVENSNTEQVVSNPSFTAVLVCQGVMELVKGDQVEMVYSSTAPGLGLIVRKPEGEPIVPSVTHSGVASFSW